MSLELFSEDALPQFSSIQYFEPAAIEDESMATIEAELKERQVVVPERLRPVVFRAIHASADFEYAETLTFSQSALDVACNLLAKASPRIVTDTNMALAGISRPACRKLGIEACCFMADEDVAKSSAESALTRAACSVDKTARLFKADGRPVVYVCGNAPTALVRIRQLSDAGIFSPAFVIGVPVGFVNVTAAKELILNSSIPHIVARGRKGGSTIAAAIMNALLYEFTGRGRS